MAGAQKEAVSSFISGYFQLFVLSKYAVVKKRPDVESVVGPEPQDKNPKHDDM